MKTTLALLSLISLNTFGSMATYQMESARVTGGHIIGGFYMVKLPYERPNIILQTERYLSNADKNRLIKEGVVRESSCQKSHNAHLLSLRGTKYSCVKESYYSQLESYERNIEKAQESVVSFSLKGFTRSYGKIYGETSFVSSLSEIPNQEYIVQMDVTECLDKYGTWWRKDQALNLQETRVERMIESLFQESLGDYVKCMMKVSTLTRKSGNPTNNLFYPVGYQYFPVQVAIEEGRESVYVSGDQGSRSTPLEYRKVTKANQYEASDNYDEDKLNIALENYGNFLKFDYGIVLSEISMGELDGPVAQLKIQKFLVQNRGKIKELLKGIDESMEAAPFFKKVSAGFYLSSVYGHIAKIEESLKTVLTLDHIIRTIH